jgi:purine-binding chemotaxis protein CheW
MACDQRYSTFYLNDICFGVPIENVQEFLEHQIVTRVPLARPVLPGIINLRGQILTTIDLRVRLGLTSLDKQKDPMMMVVRTSEGPMNLLVDKIGGVLDVDPDLFEKPLETLKPAVQAVTSHVCKLEQNLLLILDTEKIIQILEQPTSPNASVAFGQKSPATS